MATLRTAPFRVAGLFVVAISAIAVAGCGSSSSSTSSTAAAAPAPTAATAATSTPLTPSTTATTQTRSSASSSASGSTEIGTARGSSGTYLTADHGRAVYLWVADTGDKSTCSGACATAWPPVEAKGKPTAGNGANAADLGTTTRSDGSEQVTYKG